MADWAGRKLFPTKDMQSYSVAHSSSSYILVRKIDRKTEYLLLKRIPITGGGLKIASS